MSFLKEFREFAVRGNVVDMAVGVIIGGAFGKIVSSLVGDVVMPVLGILTGGVDFKDLKITLAQAVGDTPAVNFKLRCILFKTYLTSSSLHSQSS